MANAVASMRLITKSNCHMWGSEPISVEERVLKDYSNSTSRLSNKSNSLRCALIDHANNDHKMFKFKWNYGLMTSKISVKICVKSFARLTILLPVLLDISAYRKHHFGYTISSSVSLG